MPRLRCDGRGSVGGVLGEDVVGKIGERENNALIFGVRAGAGADVVGPVIVAV